MTEMTPETLKEWAADCWLLGTLTKAQGDYVFAAASAWEADIARIEALSAEAAFQAACYLVLNFPATKCQAHAVAAELFEYARLGAHPDAAEQLAALKEKP